MDSLDLNLSAQYDQNATFLADKASTLVQQQTIVSWYRRRRRRRRRLLPRALYTRRPCVYTATAPRKANHQSPC